jgi:hypothetical protein
MEIVGWILSAIAIIVICISVVKLVSGWLIYVPPNHVVVVSNSSNQMLVKTHGYHLIKWPNEHAVYHDWSYHGIDERGNRATIRHQSIFIPTQIISIDTPAYQVKDRSGISVYVDVVFRFSIVDFVAAATRNQNLFGFLAECIECATAHVINIREYQDVVGNNAHIAKLMRIDLTEQLQASGCAISTLVVQSISPNKELSETTERQRADEQKALIEQNKLTQARLLDEQRIEHEERLAIARHENAVKEIQRAQWITKTRADNDREIAYLEKEREHYLAKQSLEISKIVEEELRHKQETKVHEQQLTEQAKLAYISGLLEKGFTSDQIIQLLTSVELAKHAAVGLSNNSKMIMSPEHYRQMLSAPWLPLPASSSSLP